MNVRPGTDEKGSHTRLYAFLCVQYCFKKGVEDVKNRLIATIVGLLLSIAVVHDPAIAAVELMDGRLILSGYLKNTTYVRTSVYDREFDKKYGGSNHDSRVDFSNNSALLEVLYTVKEQDDLTIRLFGGFKYWYEAAPRLDDELRRSLWHEHRKEYISPRHMEDVISEAYVDIQKGPLQIRLGKQIVIWGQLDINRVADVVNPLDLRWGVPGVDNWEEIKRGLWMIRAFYQTQLPGNLLIELIFNPGDYKALMNPYTGTHWGGEHFKYSTFNPFNEPGMWTWLQEKQIQDQPTWNLKKNYEFGFRIRGYTWDIDWTFIYWNALDDGAHVAHPGRAGRHALQYVMAGIRSSITGQYLNPGPQPRQEIYEYKRFQTIGGTAQTFFEPLWNSVWRLEWFYEIGSPMQKGEKGSYFSPYDEVRRDVLGIAIQANWKLDIPWFTRYVCTGRQMDFSLTYFWEKIFNHDRDLVTFDRFHTWNDSVTDSISTFIKAEMFNTAWIFVFTGNYYFRAGKWMAVPCVTYCFPQCVLNGGLRIDVGAKLYGGAKHRYEQYNRLSHYMDHKDSIILRIRYEF